MTRLLRTLVRAIPSAGLAALTWSVAAQAQAPTVFNACVTPLTGILYQPKEAGKCFLPSHQAIHWTDGLGAFLGATTLGGDLSGTLPAPTVKGLRGHPVSAANPTAGQILIWDGSVWAPGNQVGGSSGAAGGALTGTYPNPALAEGVVTSTALANGSVTEPKLAFNAATQAELDAAIATAAAASATLQANINAVNAAIAAYKALLSNSGGTANAAGNPLSWNQLKDVPSAVITGGTSNISGWEQNNFYRSDGSTTDQIFSVPCSTGKKVIGGGFDLTQDDFLELRIIKSVPSLDGTGWEVTVRSLGDFPVVFGAYAVCANAAP